MFFNKKKETKTYSYEEMVELFRIKKQLDSCNEPNCFKQDKEYMTKKLERIIRTEERVAAFLKGNPEFEKELFMDLDILAMTKKMLILRIENDDL